MKYGLLILGIFLLIGCNGQPSASSCTQQYNAALKHLKSYNYTSNLNELDSAQSSLDIITCPDIRAKIIQRKFQIFILQKKYKEGSLYFEHLKDEDFELSYQRTMNSNYLLSLDYLEKGDSSGYATLIKTTISLIDNYLKSLSDRSIEKNSIAYYNLFFIKSRILKADEINSEINIFKQKYPHDQALLENIRTVSIESIDSPATNE